MKKSVLILLAVVLGWFVVSEAATEGWYRWHEMRAEKSAEWAVTWPDQPESDWKVQDFTEFPTSDQVQEVLRYDEMRGARWVDPASRVAWNVNFIEWEPDKDLNGINAVHNPTICLPSAGMELVETLGERLCGGGRRREVSMLHLRDPGPASFTSSRRRTRSWSWRRADFSEFHAGDENEPG